ncbi:P-loop containing nucleoside triphosphate hydrolase protein [Rostrohypoxylon terebratum]|nr:P-loop containing nucleoside triphosphate hydrolase protein [Rostrohypoxylon terebratum]
MEENFDRANHAVTDIGALFSGMVGFESLMKRLEGYQRIAKNAKAIDIGGPEDFIPFNFIFRGPQGTGKSITARKIVKVFYDLELIATAEVIECSASDLIRGYVSQTAPKTRKVFEKGLGNVLFIDEAYLLVDYHRTSYAAEVVGEMVAILTQEKYHNKIIIILAGYVNGMNKLLPGNPGLSSRFPETIEFENLPSQDYRELLLNSLKPRHLFEQEIPRQDMIGRLFEKLVKLPSWGNARDVKALAKNIMSTALIKGAADDNLTVQEMKKMLSERWKRAQCMK